MQSNIAALSRIILLQDYNFQFLSWKVIFLLYMYCCCGDGVVLECAILRDVSNVLVPSYVIKVTLIYVFMCSM